MTTALIIALAGFGGLAVFSWFCALEATNRRHTIFLVLVTVWFVEAILAGPAAEVSRGLLRIPLAGFDVRPPDLVIGAAIGARAVMVGRRDRLTVTSLAWLAFVAWYLFAAVVGRDNGYSQGIVLFQGKAAFYLVGCAIIGRGADLVATSRSVQRLAWPLATVTLIALARTVTGFKISLNLPLLKLRNIGALSNDTISLITIAGAIILLVESSRPVRRLRIVIPAVIALLAPLSGEQRASFLVLAVVVVTIGVASLGSTWPRRVRATPTEIALIASGLAVVAFAGLTVTGHTGLLSDRVEAAFGGEAEVRSAESRLSLYDQAFDRIKERPFVGWGLGVQVERTVASNGDTNSTAAHNFILDLWMRTGLFGLLIFLSASVATVVAGVRTWRHDRDARTAALGLGCAVGFMGVLSKSLVEPGLDKFRIAIAIGVLIGMLVRSGGAETNTAGGISARRYGGIAA